MGDDWFMDKDEGKGRVNMKSICKYEGLLGVR
jgi:hypothetical protein